MCILNWFHDPAYLLKLEPDLLQQETEAKYWRKENLQTKYDLPKHVDVRKGEEKNSPQTLHF